jgi:hypothetical protein
MTSTNKSDNNNLLLKVEISLDSFEVSASVKIDANKFFNRDQFNGLFKFFKLQLKVMSFFSKSIIFLLVYQK